MTVATPIIAAAAAVDVIETATLTDEIPTVIATGGTPTVIAIVIGATRGLRAPVHLQDVAEATRGAHHHVLPDLLPKTTLLCVALKVTGALLDGKVCMRLQTAPLQVED